MDMTVSEILTDLFKGIYIGLALFGCSLAGIPLTIEDLTDHESN
jgi:hypothetical protein